MYVLRELWMHIGENSNQLQFLLSVFAILVGIRAALYAKKQISIANEQRQDSNKLAKYNLQLRVLETAFKYEEEINLFKIRYEKEIIEKFERGLEKYGMSLDSPVIEGENHTYGEGLKAPYELLKSSEMLTTNMIRRLTSDHEDELSKEDLESSLKELLKLASTIRQCNLEISNKVKTLDKILENVNL